MADKKENKTDKKSKKNNYYTSREKSLVPSKKKSVSEELYGKQDVPTYEGEVKIKKTKKPKKVTISGIIESGREALLQGGKPKLATRGWK